MKFLSIKKLAITSILLASAAMPMSSYALCQGKPINFIEDLNWNNFFPLTLFGGVGIGTSVNKSNNILHKMPTVCSCPFHQYPGVGLTYWSPEMIAETVSEPMCFISLGETKMSSSIDPAAGSEGQDKGRKAEYKNVHTYITNPIGAMKLAEVLMRCVGPVEPFTVQFISEYYPYSKNEVYGAASQPESIAFSSPLAISATAAAGMYATVSRDPIDAVFWQSHSGKNAAIPSQYGGGGNSNGRTASSETIIDKLTYKMHRDFVWTNSIGPQAQCFAFPLGIPFPSQYRRDQFRPHKPMQEEVKTGVSPITWASGFAGTPATLPVPGKVDRAVMIWKARQCCVGK